MAGKLWHQDIEKIITINSYLTGNVIHLNTDANRFYISPTWSMGQVSAALTRFQKKRKDDLKRDYGPTLLVFDLIYSAVDAFTPAEFGAWIDKLFENSQNTWDIKDGEKVAGWRSSDKTYVRRFISDLWDKKLIIFPMNFPFKQANVASKDTPDHSHIFEEFAALGMNNTAIPPTKRFIYSTCGITSLHDLIPELVNHWLSWRSEDKWFYGTCYLTVGKKLVAYQQAHSSLALKHGVSDYINPYSVPIDRFKKAFSFKWATHIDPTLEIWRSYAAEFISQESLNKISTRAALNNFFDYLIVNPKLPRDPASYCDKRYIPIPKYKSPHASLHNYVHLWFEWLIEYHLTEVHEQTGDPVRLPWVHNPISRDRTRKDAKAQTDRSAMPLLLVQKCIEVLTANDWEWAKMVNSKEKGDWCQRYEGTEKKLTMIWSPVRAVLMFVKLRTVLRTFQVRMLDSGESDTMRLVLSKTEEHRDYHMVPNQNSLAQRGLKRPSQKGVLQARPDEQTGEVLPFLRVSTNKTADQDKDAWERGYDCPWAPDDVIEKMMYLRDWQEKNNPLREITEWRDIEELSNSRHPKQLHEMRGCFLFRDPTSVHPNKPVTNGRIHSFWWALCREVEKRLKDEGAINSANGSHYALIEKSEKGNPFYDLHSLRVTHISSLYKGGLPVKVIMMITGHATVPMCLYYTKYGAVEIRDSISRAEISRISSSQKEWATQLREHEISELEPLLAFNEQEAIVNFSAGAQGLVFMDTGICTAGTAKCSTGIVIRQTNSKNTTVYGAVPGGRANCCSCRYLISGPPFLHGLHATFNVKSLRASEIARRRGDVETKKTLLEMERHEAFASGINFPYWDAFQEAIENFDRLTVEIDLAFDEMRAVSMMVAQCLNIQNKMLESDTYSGKFGLIAADIAVVKMAFEESTEFDLIDQVLQASVIFESVTGETTARANYKRMRYYDQMLARHNLPPAFLQMDEKTAIDAGNALSKMLKARVGRKNTLELISGIKTLEDLNILPVEFYGELTSMSVHTIDLQVGIRSITMNK